MTMRTAFPANVLRLTGFLSMSITVKSWTVPAATAGLAPPKKARVVTLIARLRDARRTTLARKAAVEADMAVATMVVARDVTCAGHVAAIAFFFQRLVTG